MSVAPRYIPHYTIVDHAQWKGNRELIDGVAIPMTPSPFDPQDRFVSRLARMIGKQIETGGCWFDVYTNLDWIVCDDTVIRSDLMLVCSDQPQRHLDRTPQLVVEVLSGLTRSQDLTVKRTLFLHNKVPHYLVVDRDELNCLHVTDASELSAGVDQSNEIHLDSACDIQMTVSRLLD